MEKTTNKRWQYTLCRVLLFCLGCAGILAVSSGYTKEISKPWSTIILASFSILGTWGLTLIFVHWEKLKLSDAGVVPGKSSAVHFVAGFVIGLFLVVLQITLLLITGHIKLLRAAET